MIQTTDTRKRSNSAQLRRFNSSGFRRIFVQRQVRNLPAIMAEHDEYIMSAILSKRISHEGLDVGMDRYNIVGEGYAGPYPFTAQIESVNYDIGEK
jgi:hypothetical protein